MSMPHECICRICGSNAFKLIDPDEIGAFNRAHGARTLASAIAKIAPDLASQLAQRWEQLKTSERAALDEFLKVLRAPVSGPANDALRWICLHCTMVNGMDDPHCLGCRKPRYPHKAAQLEANQTP